MALSQEKTKPELPKMNRLKNMMISPTEKGVFFVGDDRQYFRTVEGAAPADNQAYAEADDNAAVNSRQKGVRRHRRMVNELAPPGQAEYGK